MSAILEFHPVDLVVEPDNGATEPQVLGAKTLTKSVESKLPAVSTQQSEERAEVAETEVASVIQPNTSHDTDALVVAPHSSPQPSVLESFQPVHRQDSEQTADELQAIRPASDEDAHTDMQATTKKKKKLSKRAKKAKCAKSKLRGKTHRKPPQVPVPVASPVSVPPAGSPTRTQKTRRNPYARINVGALAAIGPLCGPRMEEVVTTMCEEAHAACYVLQPPVKSRGGRFQHDPYARCVSFSIATGQDDLGSPTRTWPRDKPPTDNATIVPATKVLDVEAVHHKQEQMQLPVASVLDVGAVQQEQTQPPRTGKQHRARARANDPNRVRKNRTERVPSDAAAGAGLTALPHMQTESTTEAPFALPTNDLVKLLSLKSYERSIVPAPPQPP